MILDILSEFTLEQKIVSGFLLLEVILITFLVIASYSMKIGSAIHNAQKKKRLKKIQAYFLTHDITVTPPCLNHIGLIMLELMKAPNLSDEDKSLFIQRHIINSTRKFIHSKNLIKRYYLIETYRYYISDADKCNLIELIKDERNIISINAINISNKKPDPDIYQAIINKVIPLNRGMQELHINQLTKNDVLFTVIKNNLIQADNNHLKKVCYDIVNQFDGHPMFYEQALHDVDNTEGECQLAAIRILAKSAPENAKNKLFHLLKNKDWHIRNSVIQGIKELKTDWSIDELFNCLNDEEYWVRANAAKNLANIGETGESMLEQYLTSKGAHYKPLAAYFLDIHKLREKS